MTAKEGLINAKAVADLVTKVLTGLSAFFIMGIYQEFKQVSAKLDVVIVQQAVTDRMVQENSEDIQMNSQDIKKNTETIQEILFEFGQMIRRDD